MANLDGPSPGEWEIANAVADCSAVIMGHTEELARCLDDIKGRLISLESTLDLWRVASLTKREELISRIVAGIIAHGIELGDGSNALTQPHVVNAAVLAAAMWADEILRTAHDFDLRGPGPLQK